MNTNHVDLLLKNISLHINTSKSSESEFDKHFIKHK